jgi:hypothetical protein
MFENKIWPNNYMSGCKFPFNPIELLKIEVDLE